MLVGKNEQYLKVAFDSEAEIEAVVAENADLLFGPNSVYLPQKRISTAGGAGTIPDAVVVDLGARQWYIVEVERESHGTWHHIAPQVSKQLAAARRSEMRKELVVSSLRQIEENDALMESVEELGVSHIDLHALVEEILEKPPLVAIPIDGVPDDLKAWAVTLKNEVLIWEIEKYLQPETNKILYSLPKEPLQADGQSSPDTSQTSETTSGGGRLFRQLLEAGILVPGQHLFMKYGPRGQPRQDYQATVAEDGLDIDGRVYSPSYAAVACMKKAGSNRRTANGWVRWRTEDGRLLDEVWKDYKATLGDQTA